MKKRSCDRFNIPGTTLFYKNRPRLFISQDYSDTYYPVLDLSLGGAKFLCDERLKAGVPLVVKFNIPGKQDKIELLASVRWISRNPEQSYRYQTGIAFNSYGNHKNDNSLEKLDCLKELEKQITTK